ncbi:unnamed protein product [Oncorhynchus mykiss]|uniref:Uncharacterized protein n=1 Tax=Oncorhynchus mykiss TaxID=8022 RepID=A0A060VYU4_ONCMY|nr:unnamed protein product [Oncorhynchus mykiss]
MKKCKSFTLTPRVIFSLFVHSTAFRDQTDLRDVWGDSAGADCVLNNCHHHIYSALGQHKKPYQYNPSSQDHRENGSLEQGNFNISVGTDGYMLSALTCGMSPVTSISEGLQQIVTMGLFRTVALFYLGSFDSIVRRCMIEREQSKAADKRE